MSPDVLASVRMFLVQFEGRPLYLYQDTEGVVTVGPGLALVTVSDATPLGGTAAENAWTDVSSLPKGMAASWYAMHCDWRAQPDAVDALFSKRLEAMEAQLLAQFPQMPEWPSEAQIAVFDVAWNCGPELVHHWPNLTAALRALDWRAAAEQCATRNGPALRNDARRALFLACVPSSSPDPEPPAA